MSLTSDVRISFEKFTHFEEAAENILAAMNQFIGLNTLFVARNDLKQNHIVKVINKKEELLFEGYQLPFQETFCKISVDFGQEVLIVPDITQSELTKHLPVTNQLGSGCFIGIPINYNDGENYGTVCGIDTQPFLFDQAHINLFKTMASQLGYVLELEKALQQVENLSAPFVPITAGVAVLSVIGVINETLSRNMVQLALSKSQSLSLNYLIIDLSGVIKITQHVVALIHTLVNLLKLMGVTPIITGISPELAIRAVKQGADFNQVIVEANLENALNNIGLQLKEKA